MTHLIKNFRNFYCGLLALMLIACGRVRRARKRALSSNAITAIYFHNPNKRLFTRCVRWLAGNGYTFISSAELCDILHRRRSLPKGAVWLSFDDGFKGLLNAVVPAVHLKHIPITLFIPSGIIEGDGRFPWLHRDTGSVSTGNHRETLRDSISVEDVQELAKCPEVTIGSHTVHHFVTSNLTDAEARFEFLESKLALESWTHKDVECFAYPEGRFDGRERRILTEMGYQFAATTQPEFVTLGSDPYLVPRFYIGDEISFPEAICNMVGVWRPAISPFIGLVELLRRPADWPSLSSRDRKASRINPSI